MKININDSEIIDACLTSLTMSDACSKLGIHPNTFSKHAKRLGVYKPNIGSKGKLKPKIDGKGKIALSNILNGEHPSYQTFKLKNRLYQAGIKQNICEICNISSWQNKEIMCELDHIDGNSSNHRLENLRIICPNCHSQTSTFRAKNKSKCTKEQYPSSSVVIE